MPSSQTAVETAPDEHEICTERTFPISRQILFGTFTDPAVLASWWGPQGTVNVFETFDLRPGGAWVFVMSAADGHEYEIVNEFVEVTAPERIVVRHPQAGHEFELSMLYEPVGPGETRLRWRMRFDDASEAKRVRPFVSEANEQNFDRLEALLGVPPARTRRSAPPTE